MTFRPRTGGSKVRRTSSENAITRTSVARAPRRRRRWISRIANLQVRVRLGRPRDRCFQQGSYSAIVLYACIEESHSIDRTEPGTGESADRQSADTDKPPATQTYAGREKEREREGGREREYTRARAER